MAPTIPPCPWISGGGSCSCNGDNNELILSSESTEWELRIVLFGVIALVLIFTYVIFQGADYLTQRFGTTGLRIVQRIMGLILMIIAVQFVIDGVGMVVTGWMTTSN